MESPTPSRSTTSLWLFRGGSEGECERKFLDEEPVYQTSDDLVDDLSKSKTRESVTDVMRHGASNACARLLGT
jgi:hypothetical protein